MKTLFRILFLIYTINLSAQTYVVSGNKVYYYDQEIIGADANSFDVLYDNQFFSKDKNNVYYKGKETNYDAKTFEIYKEERFGGKVYLLDKNNVYIEDETIFVALGSQSPKKFRLITEDIALDNELIYWRFKPVFNSDAASFQIFTKNLFKDKNHVYDQGYILPIDASKMIIYKMSKGYDSYDIEYFGDQNLICNDFYNNCYQLDGSSFNYINGNYIKDNSHVIYRNNYLKTDVATFEVPIPNMDYYAKDKFHEYYHNDVFPVKVPQKYIKGDSLRAFKIKLEKQLEKAFKALETVKSQKKYDKDSKASLVTVYTFPNSKNTIVEKGQNIYMNGIRQPFIDAVSFEIFNNDYAKDKNHVYLIYEYSDKVTFNPITEIDPNTFSIIYNSYNSYCKDAKNVYCRLDKIVDADPNTFKVLNKYHAEDKNAIFLYNSKLHSIKPAQGVFLTEISDEYFFFGDKIWYLNDGIEVVVDNPNRNSFDVINENYAVNDKKLIYRGKTIGTLETDETIIEEDYEQIITSKHRVFNYGQNMSNPQEKKIYKYLNSNYSTDGRTLYYKGVFEVKDIDLAKIHHSGPYLPYFTFKNNKAIFENFVFDIDLETFEKLEGIDYARDKNYVYYDGRRTKLDPSTFFKFASDYTADKKGVYYKEKLISGADSKSFYVFGKYGFDKTYFYHYGKKILRSKINL